MKNVEEFCAALIAGSADAIIAKDIDGTIRSWNPAAERLFGYGAGEMIGQRVDNLLPPGRENEERQLHPRMRAGENIAPFLTIRVHRSGELIDVSISISPVRDAKGVIAGFCVIARDARPRLEEQRRLRESEERLRMLADNISQLAWIVRPNADLVWFNRRWYDFTGSTLERVQGQGWRAFLHPEDDARAAETFEKAMREGVEWEETFRMRSAEGEYRWFLSRAQPMRDETGELIWWFGTNTDVTEQREHEQQVRLLLMEVNHRSKNLLATVQALARRTAPDDAGFIARFEERLRSLAINQDILVKREWRQVPLAELVRAQLAFLEGAPGDISANGIDCSLAPRAAEVVGMALHELGTNSLKYGSLSVPGGRVAIGWDCTPRCERFEIWWRESDGPSVSMPTREGFGSRLIRDVPRHNLGAEVALTYAPEGLFWSLQCDAVHLAAPICTMGG